MDATESESENRDEGESFGAVIIISLLFIIKWMNKYVPAAINISIFNCVALQHVKLIL